MFREWHGFIKKVHRTAQTAQDLAKEAQKMTAWG